MINKLEWPLLEQRRAESRLVMLNRIINVAVDIACDDLVARSTSTRGHIQRLNIIQCKKDCYKYSFIPRTIVQWNNLPPDIVQLHETKTFRKSLNTIDLQLIATKNFRYRTGFHFYSWVIRLELRNQRTANKIYQ